MSVNNDVPTHGRDPRLQQVEIYDHTNQEAEILFDVLAVECLLWCLRPA
jgi:hypothetical protein